MPISMNEDIRQQKDSLRKKIISLRSGLTGEERERKSSIIQSRLLSVHDVRNALHINVYGAFRNEVSTDSVIDAALGSGKTVSVPVADFSTMQMSMSRITGRQMLVPNRYGIPEPKQEDLTPVAIDDIDVVIVPGTVFSETGWRLGYGKGFYDRFLAGYSGMTIGLAYEFQVVHDLPHDPRHDRPVHAIITEKRVIGCI